LAASCFVGPHASDDSVGEVAFVRSAGFASGLALAELAIDVDPSVVEVAMLSDADDVEHAVDPSVAAEVESMLDG